MTQPIFAKLAASISELKANPMKVVASGKGKPVAILNRNAPVFYCIPAEAYAAMVELLEDAELLKLAEARLQEPSIPVDFDAL